MERDSNQVVSKKVWKIYCCLTKPMQMVPLSADILQNINTLLTFKLFDANFVLLLPSRYLWFQKFHRAPITQTLLCQ